jgi:hypothetical protein
MGHVLAGPSSPGSKVRNGWKRYMYMQVTYRYTCKLTVLSETVRSEPAPLLMICKRGKISEENKTRRIFMPPSHLLWAQYPWPKRKGTVLTRQKLEPEKP